MSAITKTFLKQRRIIGGIGFLIPLACIFLPLIQGVSIPVSMSASYATLARDALVSLLVVTGIFMVAYEGYSKTDKVLSTIAGIGAILTAYFPTTTEYLAIEIIHAVSALTFLITTAIISLTQFTKSVRLPSAQKLKRNLVYKVCGWTIITCVALLFVNGAVSVFYKPYAETNFPMILILEAIAIPAFAISWLVKGEVILKDYNEQN